LAAAIKKALYTSAEERASLRGAGQRLIGERYTYATNMAALPSAVAPAAAVRR
jgi:hypothetical protein